MIWYISKFDTSINVHLSLTEDVSQMPQKDWRIFLNSLQPTLTPLTCLYNTCTLPKEYLASTIPHWCTLSQLHRKTLEETLKQSGAEQCQAQTRLSQLPISFWLARSGTFDQWWPLLRYQCFDVQDNQHTIAIIIFSLIRLFSSLIFSSGNY